MWATIEACLLWPLGCRGAANVTGPRVANRLLGLASMPKQGWKLRLDFSVLLGPLFYTWVVQLLLPTFLQQLVRSGGMWAPCRVPACLLAFSSATSGAYRLAHAVCLHQATLPPTRTSRGYHRS